MTRELRSLFEDDVDETSGLRVRPVALAVDTADAPTLIHVHIAGYGSFCVGCRFALGLIPLAGWQDTMRAKGVPHTVIAFIAAELEPLEL